MKIGYLAG